MFTNTTYCTVWERTVKDRTPIYIRHVTGAVYWENTDSQRVDDKNRKPNDSAFICVPAASIGEYQPKKDDRIMRGLCEEDSPPPDSLTVISVKDFLYSSPIMRHIEVTAE